MLEICLEALDVFAVTVGDGIVNRLLLMESRWLLNLCHVVGGFCQRREYIVTGPSEAERERGSLKVDEVECLVITTMGWSVSFIQNQALRKKWNRRSPD